MPKPVRAGIIGYGGQAKRISNYLKINYKKIEIINFFYKKKKLNINHTYNLDDLFKCDLIFICSPNRTHFKYLKKFLNKKYIFCEKPPVSKLSEINFLKKKDLGKVFYNYNMRFSKVFNFLTSCKKYKIGKFLDGEISFSHLLGTKKIYKKNWRSKKSLSKKGVYEVVSIHALDLISSFFDNVKIKKNFLSNKSIYGNSFDSAVTILEIEKKSYIKIFTSYLAPYKYKISFIFENGIIDIDDKKLSFYYPGKRFDNNGFSIHPKLLKDLKYKRSIDYKKSLNSSIDFFMKNYFDNKLFSKTQQLKALNSNKLIL